jgi:hypothetical protein
VTGAQGQKSNTGAQGIQGIQGLAGTGTGTTWANIYGPEWTNQFSCENVGPFISPPETTNFDIITNNSITPVVVKVYNIGQRLRHYNIVHSENVMCRACIFDTGPTTFTGSYSELRDKPANSGGTWSAMAEKPEWTTKF